MVHCPVCSLPTRAEQRADVTVDVCPSHGLWLDKGELLRITEHERHAQGRFVWADLFRAEVHPPRNEGRVLACPHCADPMVAEDYQEVRMDWCRAHGVWLDNGELEAVLNNLRLDPTYLRGLAVRFHDAAY